eukprot:GHUV01044733.1.p1 GENE.GHUV01044733.1~~GHUV01044733.1.p1  ORF type:complete len:136 (-),score=31.00 GHUV01044733.1:380-787(-)
MLVPSQVCFAPAQPRLDCSIARLWDLQGIITTAYSCTPILQGHVYCCHVEQYSCLVVQHLSLLIRGTANNKVHHCQGTLIMVRCCAVVLLLVGFVASIPLPQLQRGRVCRLQHNMRHMWCCCDPTLAAEIGSAEG